MQLSEQERTSNRAAFRAMNLSQKAEYIWAYYKLPLALALVAIVAATSIARYFLTHKDPVLYAAYANVELAEADDARLFDGYLRACGANPRTKEVYRYQSLYLAEPEGTADHQLSYASRLKLLAAIDAQELDVVLMSADAYDLLSHSGLLLDLKTDLGDGDLPEAALPLLATNDVIVEDNQVAYELGEADVYEATTEQHANAIDISGVPALADAHLSGSVYLGIIGNTPRRGEALALADYLLGS